MQVTNTPFAQCRSAQLALGWLCLAAVACGDDDPVDPNACPQIVTDELIACVDEAYDAAGNDGFRLDLETVKDACIAGQPRDLDGLAASCAARLDIEVSAPTALRSVQANPSVIAAVAAAQTACGTDCQVISSNFEIDFGKRPFPLRHDLVAAEMLAMLPAPRTWEVSSRTVTTRPLDQQDLEGRTLFLGTAGNDLATALFATSSLTEPTGAVFFRRLQRARTTTEQTVLMVYAPRGDTDFIQLIDIQQRVGNGS